MGKRVFIASCSAMVVFGVVNHYEQRGAMRAGPWHIVCGLGSQKICDFWSTQAVYSVTEWSTNVVTGRGLVVTARQVEKRRGYN